MGYDNGFIPDNYSSGGNTYYEALDRKKEIKSLKDELERIKSSIVRDRCECKRCGYINPIFIAKTVYGGRREIYETSR